MSKLLLLLLFVSALHAASQEKNPIKFGKISPQDFQTTVYNIDSGASAVVLAHKGYYYFEGNETGFFTFNRQVHKRIHILGKAAYEDANVELHLYTDGRNREQLESVKAVTYNLEDGKIKESKLENKAIFEDRLSKNTIVKKFTLPNVKEGSIIEYTYMIKSDFLFVPVTWFFQGEHPVLWSELEFRIPEFFNYVFITEGYHPFHDKQPPSSSVANFSLTFEGPLEAGQTLQRERRSLQAQVLDHRWVMKDVPGLRLESFTSALENHIARIEFQLSEFRYPLRPQPIMSTWTSLTKDLLESEYFGLQLGKGDSWMEEDLKPLIAGQQNENEKAKRIYDFVRDNFTCTDYSSIYMNQVLKNVFKGRKGNVSEINLLLVSMLKNAGLKADPVLLSTRDNGYTYSLYPLLGKFNYVIAVAEIDGRKVFMDATRPWLGYGKLLPNCYNGHARVVDVNATPLEFNPDSLAERQLTSVFMSTDEKGRLVGSFQQTPGNAISYSIRRRVNEKGAGEYFSELKKKFGAEVEFTDQSIDSLRKPDEPLVIKYGFILPKEENDMIYFNPMLTEALKENPFKSAIRRYPVEIPYTQDDTYIFRMEVPEGYQIEELPKSIRFNLDEEGISYFEYLVSASGNTISMRSRLRLNRSYFVPEEYEMLREFYGYIVKKHAEQFVFKKKQ